MHRSGLGISGFKQWAIACVMTLAMPAASVAQSALTPFDYTAPLNAAFSAAKQGAFEPAFALSSAQGAGATKIAPLGADLNQPAEVALTDLRIILALLSRSVGANNQLAIFRAQTSDAPKALTIKGGKITLSELQAAAQAIVGERALLGADGFTVPIAIWPDAQLVLEQGDSLHLDRSNGSFLVNFGVLSSNGASVAGMGTENSQDTEFRPFLVTAGTGFADIRDSQFQSLGFVSSSAYAGVAFLGGGLFGAKSPSLVMGNSFADAGTVTLQGTTGTVVQGNQFTKSASIPLIVRRTKDAMIQGNVFLDTAAKSSLRVSDFAAGSVIAGNVLLQGAGNGIELIGLDQGATVSGNIVWQHAGVGIAIDRADCAQVAGNQVLQSGKKGISLKTSRGVQISENQVLHSKNAGILISQQPDGTRTQLFDNVIAANRVGLSLSSAAQIDLAGNDLTQQFPRLLEGDVIFQAHTLLQDLSGQDPAQLTSVGLTYPGLAPSTCVSPQSKES